MNIVLTCLAVVTLVIGVYFNRIGTNRFRATVVESPDVLSDETSEPLPTPNVSPSPSPTPVATTTPTPTNKPQPSSAPNISAELSNFIYPGSTISSQTGKSVVMTSSDIPNTIMGWYNNKLNSMHLSGRKADVKNNVNNGEDSYKALLSGSNEDINIRVEITKNGSDARAKISVTIE